MQTSLSGSVDQEGIVVFTNSHPHTNGRSRTSAHRITAATISVALACGFTLAGAVSAQAADGGTPVAESRAQFLSGSLLGTNLDDVVMLNPASARSMKNGSTDTQNDPLQAIALDQIRIGDGQSIQTDLGQFLQLGAIGQYATSSPNGSSMAWSGAASQDGGIGFGKDMPPGGNATLDLTRLIGTDFLGNLSSLQLAVEAVTSKAVSNGKTAWGTYSLAGVDLKLTSPAIARLTEKVDTALDAVTNRVTQLDGSDGLLAGDLNATLTRLNPALNLVGGNAHVTATVDTGNLKSLVQDLLTTQYGDKGISFNLETGVITLNLAELAGEDLNGMSPGTELLDASVIDPALASVTTKVSAIADQIVDRVRTALSNAVVTIHADLTHNVAQAPISQKVCSTVQKVIQVPTQIAVQVPTLNGAPVADGLLAGLTGPLKAAITYVTQYQIQNISQTVSQLVCATQLTAVPPLTTSLTANITGTVNQFLTGGSIQAVANGKVLGIALPPIDLTDATSAITRSLGDQLLGSNSAITDLVTALNQGTVGPAIQGLTDGSSSVGTAVTDLVSAQVNVKELSGGTFSETALVVRVLKGATGLTGGKGMSVNAARSATDGSAARVNFARSEVGPNVETVSANPPTDGDPGTPGDPGNPGNPGTSGNPGASGGPGGAAGAAASISRLAMTGVGIAALVAAVLALLAAGAYLVREGYRRNHRPTAV